MAGILVFLFLPLGSPEARANIPGGGTGAGANVTLTGTASSSTTSTLSNGIVSIVCTKAGAQINQINYTFNNSGTSQTLNLLSGGNNGGQLYWEHSNNQGMFFTYSVVVDPATNGGDYAEISLYSTTQANMPMEVHYSMRRGSPGFYVTVIWMHDSSNGAFGMGECRNNIYAGSIFNWMSVDATRNKLMQVSGGTTVGVPTGPAECSLWTSGLYQGRYEDKYKYSAAFGDQRVWGWSSVGGGGKNVGLWDVSASAEYYNGGPLKQELMCHMGTTILNMFNGGHYGMGDDGSFVVGETWAKVCGPYLVYCNNVSNTITDPVQASQALYADALAQGTAEASGWPYSWFSNTNYAGPANRGTVTGKIVINDTFNPGATASNLWVGLIQQPWTSTGTYDFQQWMKPYQFWVHSDANGNFTIPAVIAGSNYTLYAFGQGAPGTFMSQAQTGGTPPLLVNLPASPFGVTVAGGTTMALGTVTWTPTRVGPTVFEIGYPDRTARKFRHGEDWWVGDIGASPTAPSPVWSKWLEYPFDFPSGPNYLVGTSRWTTDWNFCQPVVLGTSGNWNNSSSTVTFNLASGTSLSGTASLYLGLASNYYSAIIITVNGKNLGGVSGLTATPNTSVPTTGYYVSNGSGDATIRESTNASSSDERLTFPASILNTGTTANTITIGIRQAGGSYFADHAMYDYVRLELTGYVPPAPATVSAYAGNNAVLISWPAKPGATSYNVLRSTTSGTNYSSIASGVTGPICGSGPTNAIYVDNTAANGTTYYYVVQSVNPVNSSPNSAQSPAVTPSSGALSSAPNAPTGLTASSGSSAVTLNWTALSGANCYTVKRSTLTLNGGGSAFPLNTITLTNSVNSTSYTDTSPTNGTIYSYSVVATNAVGSSGDSTAVDATPIAVAPTAAPATLSATALQGMDSGSITLTWPAASGAVGYLVQRASSFAGPYTFLSSVSTLTMTDSNLAANSVYYYQVATMNSGGASFFVTASAITPPAPPATVTATGGSSRVTLNWVASTGATSYVLSRSTTPGGPYTVLKSGVGNITYVDRTVSNGTTYYYVVAATGAGGTGDISAEATVTPVGVPSVTWTGAVNTTWNTTTANWVGSGTSTAYANGEDVLFDDTAAANTVVISGTVTPDDVLISNTGTYTFTAAGLSGSTSLTKLGTGTLTISGVNTFVGGTTIEDDGVITIAGGTNNGQNRLGTGMITLDNGTLIMNGNTGSTTPYYGTLTNTLSIPTGSTGTLKVTQRGSFSGDVIGGGTLTLAVNYVRGDMTGDWSGFSGQINVIRTRTGTNVDNFRLLSNTGFGIAAIDLGAYVQVLTTLNASNTFTIGELSGDVNAKLSGIIPTSGSPGSYTVTFAVGGRDTDATFAGSVTNGSSPSSTAITKEGAGTWTLSGSNPYTGATVINDGTLNITGTLVNTGSLTVAAGGMLFLNGGTVSVAGPITNQGVIRLNGTGSLTTAGTFTNNGVLDLINGPKTLPAHFINNGTVIDSSAVVVSSINRGSGGTCTIGIPGYGGHAYQLQSSSSLTSPSWQNVGGGQSIPSTQVGSVSVTLVDSTSNTQAKFYRIVVTSVP